MTLNEMMLYKDLLYLIYNIAMRTNKYFTKGEKWVMMGR